MLIARDLDEDAQRAEGILARGLHGQPVRVEKVSLDEELALAGALWDD